MVAEGHLKKYRITARFPGPGTYRVIVYAFDDNKNVAVANRSVSVEDPKVSGIDDEEPRDAGPLSRPRSH